MDSGWELVYVDLYYMCVCVCVCVILTVDVCAKVDLTHVVVLQDSRVACVWGVVSGTVVQRAARGEGQPCIQTILLYQHPRTALQTLTEEEERQKREEREGRGGEEEEEEKEEERKGGGGREENECVYVCV